MASLRYLPLDHFVTYLRQKHNVDTLIETGTYQGETTIYAAERFNRVVTIDIRQDFQDDTKIRCQGLDNIEFMCGDSRTITPGVVAALTGPAIFWFDAHSVAPCLFGDRDDWPIIEELEAINASPFKHYVLIDDAHCFLPDGPHPHVPPVAELEKLAQAGGYAMRVSHDVIALVPVEEAAELDELGPPSTTLSRAKIAITGGADVRRRFSVNLMPKFKTTATAAVGYQGPPIPEPVKEDLSITEVVNTSYGKMLIPRFDTNQSPALRSGYALNHHEIQLLMPYLEHRKPGAVFLDVGANVGVFSFGLRPLCAYVHAFEPQRMLSNMISGSIALNGWSNVHCYNVALGDKEGRVEIPQFDYASRCSFGSIEFGPEQREELDQKRQHDDSKIEYVDVHRLDDYRFGRVDMIKIDVEGMEFKVLRGAEQTIALHHPVIMIEHYKVHAPTLYQELRRLGYKVRDLGSDFLATPGI